MRGFIYACSIALIFETKIMPDTSTHEPGELAAAAPHSFTLTDGTVVTIRAIQPEDSDIEQEFVRSLSATSKRMRFFANLNELSPKMLDRFTHPLYPCNWALIATVRNEDGEEEIGVSRYASSADNRSAELAVVVADQWQGKGIATHLLRELIKIAKIAGIESLEGVVLKENYRMRKLVEKLGFTIQPRANDDPSTIHVVKNLTA